ncbi:MAG: CDP-alcohol phosphatidyltransferase family protein [Taibaiella sp.]|nr:CDP-alcohol phosphatidyltransferase family protein [Taibaiella sp.]
MKHLPNLLTLGNLFCGCVAIAYILTAQPFVYRNYADGQLQWIMGTEQLYMGSLFILIAAFFDLLDGFTARALNVFSPIGKDLDSLADMVSFGAAPSMILFKCLWDALMQNKNAFDVSMVAMTPAFLIACFAALRLAKYNITASTQKSYFIGMPTPAVGLFIASFPLLLWNSPFRLPRFFQEYNHYVWLIYLIIALLCFLMVSNIRFFKMIPAKFKPAYYWPQAVILVAACVLIPLLKIAAIFPIFGLYIVLSVIYKHPSDPVKEK